MERRIAALVLIAAGVWVQWGPGFGLVVAGALLAVSGLEPAPLAATARRHWIRTRAVAAAAPRRFTAAGLVAAAAVALPAGAVMAAGAWAGWMAAGAIFGVLGVALGWE